MPSNYLNLKKIQETEVQKEYFPFFTVSNSFLEDVNSSALVEDFPDISEGGSFPVDLNAGQNIKDLIKELEGPEFRKLLEDKFKVELKNKPAVTTLRGYSRLKDGKIHTDSSTKTVTVLLYLNQNWNENEGHLRLLKDSEDLTNYIEEVPCTFGSMVGFRVTKNCWHGFQPYEGKRLSLQLNYISSQSLGLHNARHCISAFFKQFFKS
jgi:SM-20-related protein